METVLWIIAVVLVLAGFAGMVLPVLPGTVLIFAGLLAAAWADGFERVGWATMAVLGALTVLSLFADVLMSGVGAKGAGASRQAVAGAAAGAVVGLFFGIPGIIVGPFIGAVLGEFLARRDLVRAGRVGYGTMVGLVLGAGLKIALALGMIGLFVLAYCID